VMRGETSVTEKINIGNLDKGVYFIRMENGGETRVQKFVKE
jgi:hypothetical protein